jgi:ABC-type amino acid transport system permease subunit
LSALQWYLIFDLILGGLLLFALGQFVQLYRRWNDAVTMSWRTVLLIIVDLLFGALILIGVPVVLERGWDLVLTVSADLGGGLFVIALLLLIVVGVQVIRFLRASQATTAQQANALAAQDRIGF